MKKIKRCLGPLGLAIFCGIIFGRSAFGVYRDNLFQMLNSSKLYLLLDREYDSLDLLREDTYDGDLLYYNDSGKYERVIGITNRYENVSKIKKLYNDQVMVMEYYISDKISEKQREYDDLLIMSENDDEIRVIVKKILELYREDDSVKLIAG